MGTQRTKSGLETQIDSVITTGLVDGITGAILNTLLDDFTASLVFNNGTTSLTTVVWDGSYSGSSGTQSHMTLEPTFNQSGTASSIGFLVNVIGTAFGSGSHRVADFRLDSASIFAVYKDGYFRTSEIATPGSPNSGFGNWYMDSADSKPKVKNDAGTVYDLTVDVDASTYVKNTGTDTLSSAVWDGSYSGSSGTQTHLTLETTINQTGTAASIGLLVNVIGTAFGSGSHRVADFRLDSASIFSIYKDGYFRSSELSEPATPSSGFGNWYVDSADSKPKFKNDAGTVYDLTAAV